LSSLRALWENREGNGEKERKEAIVYLTIFIF